MQTCRHKGRPVRSCCRGLVPTRRAQQHHEEEGADALRQRTRQLLHRAEVDSRDVARGKRWTSPERQHGHCAGGSAGLYSSRLVVSTGERSTQRGRRGEEGRSEGEAVATNLSCMLVVLGQLDLRCLERVEDGFVYRCWLARRCRSTGLRAGSAGETNERMGIGRNRGPSTPSLSQGPRLRCSRATRAALLFTAFPRATRRTSRAAAVELPIDVCQRRLSSFAYHGLRED